MDFDLFLDVLFLLVEVVIKLINKLLRLLQANNVSLSSRVSLSLYHLGTLERADHLELVASSFDFSFVLVGVLLFVGQNGLGLFRFGSKLHFFEQRLSLPDLLQLILDSDSFLGKSLSQV